MTKNWCSWIKKFATTNELNEALHVHCWIVLCVMKSRINLEFHSINVIIDFLDENKIHKYLITKYSWYYIILCFLIWWNCIMVSYRRFLSKEAEIIFKLLDTQYRIVPMYMQFIPNNLVKRLKNNLVYTRTQYY